MNFNMMPITFNPPTLTADEEIKQKAATQQMTDLLDLLEKGEKYRTLSTADRQSLLEKGFANDLVDNLIFFTERALSTTGKTDDSLVLGFTYSAFDPSIYGCESIRTALQLSHAGRCAYCESQIDHIKMGCVSHYRPAWGAIDSGGQWRRNAYYMLAYEPKNLLLSCVKCHEVHKSSQFPVHGQQAPEIAVDQEQSLIVNPYEEDPRLYIRFNPNTGEAFAYDEFSQFCLKHYQLDADHIEKFIWQHPDYITEHIQMDINTLKPEYSNAFMQWKGTDEAKHILPKGRVSIDVLGLNRPALIKARQQHVRYLKALVLLNKQHLDNIQDNYQEHLQKFTSTNINHSFCSLAIDTVNTCFNEDQTVEPWTFLQQAEANQSINSHLEQLSPMLSSSLQYMVLETELELEDKRRIVYLHHSDYLYGSDRGVKTVFLPIDWQKDFNNVIKVFTGKNTWEASFSELAKTQPVALQNLFANNEVWAEGDYASLV